VLLSEAASPIVELPETLSEEVAVILLNVALAVDPVMEDVTTILFDVVFPLTVRFVPTVALPVIVVRSLVLSPSVDVPLLRNETLAVRVFAYREELFMAN
jgi:hypothetical protein